MKGSVCGYVLRADNEMPLEDATVMIAGRAGAAARAATDNAGWFNFDGISPGKCVLRARGPNDEIGEAAAQIFDNAFTNVTILVATCSVDEHPPASGPPAIPRRTGRIEGHVIQAQTERPVENATITVVRGPGPLPDIAPLTDSTGWFELVGLLPGMWVLLARSPDDETSEMTVQVSNDELTKVTIAVAASPHSGRSSNGVSNVPKHLGKRPEVGSVEGHVVNARTGLPVEDAAITVVQGAGSVPDIAPLTDSGGWFALDGLVPGDWVLRARGPNEETGEAAVRVTVGDAAQITIAVLAPH